MTTPEMGFNPELQNTKLPEASEFQGSISAPETGKTNLESAVKLARILNAVEQE